MAENQKINLNLDTVEVVRHESYKFNLGSHVYTFTDPADLDWQLVEHLSSLDALAEHCMSDEDRAKFYLTPLASKLLNVLFEDVQRHFELGAYAPKRRR